jgi:hypothetical protein
MHRPTIPHWSAVKRILRYLKQTVNHSLLLQRNSSYHLQAFYDVDWAGCPDDQRFTSGYCLFLSNNLVSWSSRKQKTTSRSSTGAEYRAVADATAELIWVQSLLRELGISIPQAPIFWCDKIGATYLMANPLFHARTKYVSIDYHFVHDQGSPQSLSVRFISSKDQLTDTFTKPLPTTKFTSLRDNLHVLDLLLMLRGHIETALNTQDNDPPDPIRSRNKCSKIIEVVDEQPSKIMEATSETLEDKNKNN